MFALVILLLVVTLSPSFAATCQPRVSGNCTASASTLLASHATSTSCFTIITVGSVPIVYDITLLLGRHEGGRAVVEQMCGVDGSIGFWCSHNIGELQEAVCDGLAVEVCRHPTAVAGRSRVVTVADDGEEDGDDDAGFKCGAAGTGALPPAPSTSIAVADIEAHNRASSCWTVLGNSVIDITPYVHLHPGGIGSAVAALCGGNGTLAFAAQHPFNYIVQGVASSHMTMLGTAAGTVAPPASTAASLISNLTVVPANWTAHNTAGDCYIAVSGLVYDATNLKASHPGGGTMVVCGADVTASFSLQHALDVYVARLAAANPVVGRIAATTATTAQPAVSTGSSLSSTALVAMSDVAQHNTTSDCWVAVLCKVLNVTAYIPLHSGDTSVQGGAIGPRCGGDLTVPFSAVGHSASFIDVALSRGAVLVGALAGCGSSLNSTVNAVNAIQSGWVHYKVTYGTLTLPSNPAEQATLSASIKAAIAVQLQAASIGGVLVEVYNLTAGSVVAAVGLGFSTSASLASAQAFGLSTTGLKAAVVNSSTPTVSGAVISMGAWTSGSSTATTTGTTAPITMYTMLQVADHKTAADCWLVIDSTVWSVANGGVTHPSGSMFSRGLCGADASSTFGGQHSLQYLQAARMARIGATAVGQLTASTPRLPLPSTTLSLPPLDVQLNSGGSTVLSSHNSESDCYMAIDGTVYDATALISKHEGGRANVLGLCGIDATSSFWCHHDNEELQEAQKDGLMTIVGTLRSTPVTQQRCTAPPREASLAAIAGEQVILHASAGDCWIVIANLVYDVTSFKHTGGSAVVATHCGADATAAFVKNHPYRSGSNGYVATLMAKGSTRLGYLSSPIPARAPSTVNVGAITAAELAAHSVPSSCWIRVHQFVVDVTNFLAGHSGGAKSISDWCGKDASSAFDSAGHPLSYLDVIANQGKGGIMGCFEVPCSQDVNATTNLGPTLSSTVTAPSRACTVNEPSTTTMTVIPWSTIKAKNTAAACYVVLGCGVYDVSAYTHSGGDALVNTYCGRDAHASFAAKHPMQYLNTLIARGGKLVGKPEATTVEMGLITRKTPIPIGTIRQHNTITDCWACIAGTVYDLSSYAPLHEGGVSFIRPFCGGEGTLFLLHHHDLSVMKGLPSVGSCNFRANQAWMEQNIMDAAAFVIFVIFPIIIAVCARRILSHRTQDFIMRRSIGKPRSGAMGHLLNSFLEMSGGVFILLVLYLCCIVGSFVAWYFHYKKYYPASVVLAGAFGRTTVYAVCMATFAGIRRWTWTWWVLKISYEKALKIHYVVGIIASCFILMHGITYIVEYNANLPEGVAASAWAILGFTAVMSPLATVTNVRVNFYVLFRISHFLVTGIVIAGLAHILLLGEDGQFAQGFIGAAVWFGTATSMHVLDTLWTIGDAFTRRAMLISPAMLLGDGPEEEQYIALSVIKRRTTAEPGTWFSVARCVNGTPIQNGLSHPFTGIVRQKGGIDKLDAEIEFVWKVGEGYSWTRHLHSSIASGMVLPSLLITGPYGGGLGALENFNTIVFVCAGVGITPAASMAPHLMADGRRNVIVIWSFRSLTLYAHCRHYFQRLPTQCCFFHYTGKKDLNEGLKATSANLKVSLQQQFDHFAKQASNSQQSGVNNKVMPSSMRRYSNFDDTVLTESLVKGRPNVLKTLEDLSKSANGDIGVFVCGPSAMVADVEKAADTLNVSDEMHIHVHSESFQM